jgi:putative ABC transport system permease protein
MTMFANYLAVALRRLARNRLGAAINIGGLAVGFAAVTLIGLFVLHELSYDRWLPDVDSLYKVEFTETEPGHGPLASAMTPAPLAAALLKDYGDISVATRLKAKNYTVRQGNRQFTEEIYFVDPNFFDVFDLPVVAGSREAVLANGSNVAISERMARKYFGDDVPVGQVITLAGQTDKVVAAVLRDIPRNSHFDIDILTRVSAEAGELLSFRDSWGSDQVHTYLKVAPGFDAAATERDGRAFAARNISLDWTNLPPADLHHYNFIPVADIHLYSDKDNHEATVGDITTVVTFALVAVLVLALATINFMNLSTAQALRSAREVGIRKVLGASRAQIVNQFLGEAVLTTFFALLLGMTLVEIFLPVFSSFLGKEISLSMLASVPAAIGIVCLVIVTGVCGGMYPALVVSALKPATILRDSKSPGGGRAGLRNLLVVLQFSVSIALIAATGVIYRQTDYVRSVDLGFEPAGKILIPVWEETVRPATEALKNSLAKLPGVQAVGTTSAQLPNAPHGLGVFVAPGDSRDEAKSITQLAGDPGFYRLMEMTPLAGRLFDAGRSSDFLSMPSGTEEAATRGVVLNESAVTLLGFDSAELAIGQKLSMPAARQPTVATIVGVVPDMHLGSLRKAIEPMAFFVADAGLPYLVLDIEVAARSTTMREIEAVWASLVPGAVLSTTFLEDAYAALYLEAERQTVIFTVFAAFAVFVACLGLYGLAAFTAQYRTKEIGIRKVVGARVVDIVLLLTWQFSRLVLVAAPAGLVISAFGMQEWLTGFAYRISLFANSWIFAAAALAAFAIAWLTLGIHAARVARTNPIQALRHE